MAVVGNHNGIDKALAELRSLEQKRRKIDDESVPFLAHLRNWGLLNDEDWLALQNILEKDERISLARNG